MPEIPDPFATPPTVEMRHGMPFRRFGRTGERVSILGVGGFHIGIPADPQDGVRIVREALDGGINFLDNAWEYNGGVSEERMGLALADGYRAKAFLMTKVCARDRAGALAELEDSLRRLQTDVIDLWMFHECNLPGDPAFVFREGGALEAGLEAKRQGKVRYLGFTGHKSPAVHATLIEQGFPWDAALMPLNVADAHHESFTRRVLPLCLERDIAVIAMKSLGGTREIVEGAPVSIEECLRYSLGLNVSVLISGMDNLRKLRANMDVARRFAPFSRDEREALLARVAPMTGRGELEHYKTTLEYDSPIHRAQHGLV